MTSAGAPREARHPIKACHPERSEREPRATNSGVEGSPISSGRSGLRVTAAAWVHKWRVWLLRGKIAERRLANVFFWLGTPALNGCRHFVECALRIGRCNCVASSSNVISGIHAGVFFEARQRLSFQAPRPQRILEILRLRCWSPEAPARCAQDDRQV